MSRSGYIDDWSPEMNLYRGSVTRSIKGKRGQKALRDLLTALDAMSVKELHTHAFGTNDGCRCTLGVLAESRGIDPTSIPITVDEYDGGVECDIKGVAEQLDIAECFAAEVMYLNDECDYLSPNPGKETPADRWARMRAWVASNIKGVPSE